MPRKLDPVTQKHLVARVNYYRELGIYDFYRRPVVEGASPPQSESGEAREVEYVAAGSSLFESALPVIQDKPAALEAIRGDIGECTRCRLHRGRKNIVFGVGNVDADIMFIGEGPGADEDEQGEPFVGRAGQLLNNMIAAMGIERRDVYIANVVELRPPPNPTPRR